MKTEVQTRTVNDHNSLAHFERCARPPTDVKADRILCFCAGVFAGMIVGGAIVARFL